MTADDEILAEDSLAECLQIIADEGTTHTGSGLDMTMMVMGSHERLRERVEERERFAAGVIDYGVHAPDCAHATKLCDCGFREALRRARQALEDDE